MTTNSDLFIPRRLPLFVSVNTAIFLIPSAFISNGFSARLDGYLDLTKHGSLENITEGDSCIYEDITNILS
jgi:hypothetical protein